MKKENPKCKCGEIVLSLYSRANNKFTFLDLFYCNKCDKVFVKELKEKEVELI